MYRWQIAIADMKRALATFFFLLPAPQVSGMFV